MTQMLVESFVVLWSIGSAPYNPWSTICACTLQLQISTLRKCAVHAEEEEEEEEQVNRFLIPILDNFERYSM